MKNLSNETGQRKKIYPGWLVVAGCFLIMAMNFTPAMNLAGQLIPYWELEFNVSRTAALALMTVYILSIMAGSLFAGRFLAHFGIRKVLVLFSLVVAAAYVAGAFAGSLFQLYILAAIRGLCGSAMSVVPISMLINSWFGRTNRGKAMGLAMLGSGIGSMVLSPVVGFIAANSNWRSVYLFFALLAAAVVPVVLFCCREPSADQRPERQGESSGFSDTLQPGDVSLPASRREGLSAREALKSGVFWAAFFAILLHAGAGQSWNSNGASYLFDLGYDGLTASSLLSLAFLGLTLGKPALGVFADRFGTLAGTVGGSLVFAAGYLLAIAAAKFTVLTPPSMFFLGFGLAVVNIVLPLMAADLFGDRDYPVLVGYLQIASSLGACAFPLFMAMIFDAAGSFVPAWFAALGLVVAGLFLSRLAYRLSARGGPAEKAGYQTASTHTDKFS